MVLASLGQERMKLFLVKPPGLLKEKQGRVSSHTDFKLKSKTLLYFFLNP